MRRQLLADPSTSTPSTGTVPQDLLTTAEVAQIFGRTPRTIRNWITQGLLIPLPLPGPRLFRRRDVEQLLDCLDPDQASEKTQLCSVSS